MCVYEHVCMILQTDTDDSLHRINCLIPDNIHPLPRSTVLLQNLTSSQLFEKFPAFYGTRRFITTFQNPVLSPEPDQSIP